MTSHYQQMQENTEIIATLFLDPSIHGQMLFGEMVVHLKGGAQVKINFTCFAAFDGSFPIEWKLFSCTDFAGTLYMHRAFPSPARDALHAELDKAWIITPRIEAFMSEDRRKQLRDAAPRMFAQKEQEVDQ